MRGIRPLPLSLRVPLLTVVLMVLVGIIASQQVLTTLRNVQNERIRELAQLQIEALSVALGPLVLRKNVWEVYDTLDRATGETHVQRLVFTAVADENGNILAATNPKRAPLDSPIKALAQDAQNLETLAIPDQGTDIRLLSDLTYQDRKVGQILIELDVSDLLAERSKAARLLLIGNAVATGFLALLGYFGMRRMLRPITLLVSHMRNSGERPEPIPQTDLPRGDTEMTRLFHSYNGMVGSIEAKAEADKRLANRERFVSLGRLSASLAHEINNPLGGLLNAADTIKTYADRPEVVRESAELLTRGLGHLRDVARATLDQNRLDRSGAVLVAEDFDDLRLLIRPEVSRKSQDLDWRIEADQKDLSQLAAAPVRQIVLNLLLNATEASGQGGKVGLRVYTGDNSLCIKVSDTGPGLSKAACARLLGNGPASSEGGVGLRLVHDMTRELQGFVRLNRADGVTTISIELPLKPENQGDLC